MNRVDLERYIRRILDDQFRYTTKQARPIHARTAQVLIATKAVVPEAELFPGESASAWVVAKPVDQEAV